MPDYTKLLGRFNLNSGTLSPSTVAHRRLSDLIDTFANSLAWETLVAGSNPLLYTLSIFEPAQDQGALGCTFVTLQPGHVGDEYFMTRGHFHAWSAASEFYITLAGTGLMLLEDQTRAHCAAVPMQPEGVLYVPGHTAHRTVNTGDTPLQYLSIYPVLAGHDYQAIRSQNFRHVVVSVNDHPTVLERTDYAYTSSNSK
jgi:glucose-6-phosphate isomerase, archaeal